MSGNLNRSGNPKKILIVLANPAISTTLGWPVGFWASELTHAWYEFTEAGYEVTLASPNGGKCELDAYSDPRDKSGYSAHDVLSMGYIATPALWSATETTAPLASLDLSAFDALYIAGGQAPMFTFRDNPTLTKAIRTFHDAGKIVSAVCHGVAALIDIRVADGTYLIANRQMTGFANSEEDYADKAVGQRVMPWRIEDAAREHGANFQTAPVFREFALRDGNLITGQQQFSGRAAARLIIEALGR